MVYCGRPSRICLHCRRRKLPCDLNPAPCGQCGRAGLSCSGYRDVDQLRIRDESESVKKKILSASTRSAKDDNESVTSITAPAPKVSATALCTSNATQIIPPLFAIPLDEQARTAFCFHYVTNDLRTHSYLQSFFSSSFSEKHLSASVDAVSLAFFSQWWVALLSLQYPFSKGSINEVRNPFGVPHLIIRRILIPLQRSRMFWIYLAYSSLCDRVNLSQALNKTKEAYVSALQLISEAIQNPDVVSHDTTLLAALLLDLFEKMTTSMPHLKGAWVNHVNGAFTLVQLRGRDQFKRPLGIRLLVRLCTNLLISCVASHQPIPAEFVHLRTAVAEFVDSNDPKWQLMGLMVRFVELRQASKSRVTSHRKLLDLVRSLDDDFTRLGNTMPLSWQYETISTDACSDRISCNRYHVYPSVHVTQTWNVLRLARIMINEIILDKFSEPLDPSTLLLASQETITERETAKESIIGMVSDICASVRQYTGQDAKMLNANRIACGKRNRMSFYTLLFPLFVAEQSRTTPPSLREWIIAQLHHMSEDLGVRNAKLILNILEHGEWVEPWSVYAMLGGYAFVA